MPEEIRVVLTWGTAGQGAPADLDAHLSGPKCDVTDPDDLRFHVLFSDQVWPPGDPYVDLDHDDLSYQGPETITIRPFNGGWVPGEYDYWVHNYSKYPDYGTSSALVTVFWGEAQIAEYRVDDESGVGENTLDIWRVVNIMVDENGLLTPLNTEQHGFLDDPDGSFGQETVPEPIITPAPVACPGP
jgi:hypothetical protein